jgi:hypothetical protein
VAADWAYPQIAVGRSSVNGAGRGVAMRLQTRLLMVRATLLLRRANRRRRQQLAGELATYTGQADLNDLYALLESYPDGQTSELREILGRQQIHRSWTAGRAI